MVLHGGDGTIIVPYGEPASEEDILRGKLAMDKLLLEIEEEHGYKRVHDRIEELKSNIKEYQKKLQQMEVAESVDLKIKRTKGSRWNWR